MVIERLPPGANGPVFGVLRVRLALSDTPFEESHQEGKSGRPADFELRWWPSTTTEPTYVSSRGAWSHASFEIRCGRQQFSDYLTTSPNRQALEITACIDKSGKPTVLSGFVPLASLIERLSASCSSSPSSPSSSANLQVADIPVSLKPRPESPNSPLGSPIKSDERYISLVVTIDVSFDDESATGAVEERLGLMSLVGGSPRAALDPRGPCGARTSSPGSDSGRNEKTDGRDDTQTCDATHARHASLVLGRDSLDDVSSEPGWPLDARRMDVQVGYVYFNVAHAPLHMNDTSTVYLSLATWQNGKDQQRTRGVGFAVKPKRTGTDGSSVKMMHASWKNEVVTFDPLSLGETELKSQSSSDKDRLRTSTDSHQSSVTSTTAESPILRVGLWKSVTMVDQFHSFSDGAATPNESLIGSAVVVVTGALGEEEGIEIPLYDDALNKSGIVHLKIGMCRSKTSMEALEEDEVDEQSRLNYEILSNMEALKRQVMPSGQKTTRRYAMSGSSDDSDACVGIAYEGAVSDYEDEDEVIRPPSQEERGRIINDDWMFNIEKSVQ